MIIQGSNEPIVIEFDDVLENIAKISIVLVTFNGKILKIWNENDVTVYENQFSIPLKETETMEFPAGLATLDIKVLDAEGRIIFFDEIDLLVKERLNKEVLIDNEG